MRANLELLDEIHRELADPVIAGLHPAPWRGRSDPREPPRKLIDAVFRGESLRPGIQRLPWACDLEDPDLLAPFVILDAVQCNATQACLHTGIRGS